MPEALLARSAPATDAPAMVSLEEADSLCREILERYEEVNLLYRLGESLAGVLGTGEICWRVLQEAATITRARSGCVLIAQAEGGFKVAAEAGDEALRLAESRGPALTERTVHEDGDGTGAGSLLSIPLGRGRIGQLVLAEREGGPFTAGEKKLVTAVAAMAGIFIENGTLAQRMKQQERVVRELEIAREIQRSLLPSTRPAARGLQVAGAMRPASEMGGDHYGWIVLPDGRLGVVVADVMGHDIAATIGMVVARSIVRVVASDGSGPARVLERANALLCEDLGRPGLFVTAFYALIDGSTGDLSYSSAGHHPPVLIRAGKPLPMRRELMEAGPGLGILESAEYPEGRGRLEQGDLMILYTDGVVEARSPSGELFGTDRLAKVAAAAADRPVEAVCDAVFDALAAFTESLAASDDTTVVAIRRAA